MRLMSRKKELLEARSALERALTQVTLVKKEVQSAQNWGLFDIFAGDFFISLLKRNKITRVNEYMEQLKQTLVQAQKELADINMELLTDISNNSSDYFWDVWFDNIFTDFRVQGQLDKVADQLEKLEHQLKFILKDIQKILTTL